MKEARIYFFNLFEEFREKENVDLDNISNFVINNSFHGFEDIEKVANAVILELEIEKLVYSNKYECNTIIEKVLEYTNDQFLKHILENIFIGFLENPNTNYYIKALTYEKFQDNSCLVIFNKKLYENLMALSNIFSSKYLSNRLFDKVNIQEITRDIYSTSKINLQLYNDKELGEILYYSATKEYEDEFIKKSNEILEVGLAFIIGHEIGHHYYNHFEGLQKEKNFLGNEEISKKILELNQKQKKELIADFFAIRFAVNFLDCYYPSNVQEHQITGLLIPFICMGINANDVMQNSEEHPSTQLRLILSEKVMTEYIKLEGINNAKKDIDWLLNELCLWENKWWD